MDKKKEIITTSFESQVKTAKKKDVLRTAAYCRVSTLMEEQELSYESQCAYYEKLISSDPNMVLVDVYGDQGISGLQAETRPELQRMLQDCRNGKIDYVITRSISRLARNAAQCQAMIDELNALGIPIMFEKENCLSTDPQLSLIMKLLISAAQEESNSISQAISWSYMSNVKMGKPTRICPYGYRKKSRVKRTDPHIWEVYEPEAEKIRKAFQMLIDGFNLKQAAAELTRMEKAEGSDYVWRKDRIRSICRNEAYKGDILTNKYFKPDFLSKCQQENRGERPQYYLEKHHDAIVDEDTFDEVQIILDSFKEQSRKKVQE